MKTQLEREADSIDCDFYRVLARIEGLWKKYPERSLERNAVSTCLHYMRAARPHLRGLMAKEDREVTS